MIIKVEGIRYRIHLSGQINEPFDKIPMLFLHGFTGSGRDWHFLFGKLPPEFFPLSIDLIGHGESDSPGDPGFYTTSAMVRHLRKILDAFGFGKIILAGYSMGGRLALSFYDRHPDYLRGLILESSSPGIEDESGRKERYANDSKLSEMIVEQGTEKFIEFWASLPIFESLKTVDEDVVKTNFEQKLKNSPVGLSNSLTGFSQGIMESLWSKIETIDLPVLLISGKRDEKYVQILTEMNKKIPGSTLKVIEAAGHNTHLEKPEEFINLLIIFLRTIKR